MLLRRSRIQLVVFAGLSLIALTIVSFTYAGLPRQFGYGQMSVAANFEDASGIYPAARVTYRGVDIGQVKSLEPELSGVLVRLQIDTDAEVPADTTATIRSTSAIGEQYVDLAPQSNGGPLLQENAVIPQKSTVGMPAAGDVLDSAKSLIDSIPESELSRLLGNVDIAFGDSGDNLHVLVKQSSELLQAAHEDIDPTVDLINLSAPFLATQADIRTEQIRSIRNLARVTDTLVDSNSDLVRLLKRSEPFADRFNDLVNDLEPTLPVLLANFGTLTSGLNPYLPGLQQALAMLPAAIAWYQGALIPYKDPGGVMLDFKLQVNEPKTCTEGFLPKSEWRDPRDVSVKQTPPGLWCKLPKNSDSVIRGARNYPCLAHPGEREATIDLCARSATGRDEPEPEVAYLPGHKRGGN